MWPADSQNTNDLNRNSQKNEHSNNINEQGPIYQTPFKQSLNIERSNDTPLQIDFNFYFGILWPSEHIPSQYFDIPINKSVTKNNSETNLLLFKSSLEKSGYKLSSISEIKCTKIIDKEIHDNNNNNIYDDLNQNKFTKKNLNELFDNAKNDEFLKSNKKDNNIKNNSFEKNNIYYCDIKYNNVNNIFIPNNCINNNLTFNNKNNNNHINNEFVDDKENSNYNFVDEQNIFNNRNNENNENKNVINTSNFNNMNIDEKKEEAIFSSPINKKPKKIFECSGSTFATNSSKSSTRKRRFRKNNEQITMLLQFFNENKHWSRDQIKEISERTGLKENKVYKWLWDQRNKEYKSTKFVINKKNLP